MEFSLLKDIVLCVAAFSGMILGFYNLIHTRRKEKVKLKVIPVLISTENIDFPLKSTVVVDSGNFEIERKEDYTVGVSVINLSSFPVVIEEVGLTTHLFNKENERLIMFGGTSLNKGERLPQKLEPHDRITMRSNLSKLLKLNSSSKIRKAYATTSCGVTFIGKSKALKKLKKFLKNKSMLNS